MAKIKPGEYYITRGNESITTVLGSCVAACIRDPKTTVGGMNHFMLPLGKGDVDGVVDGALRYGNFAMEHLINGLVKYGASRGRLEIKLFGGANLAGLGQNVGQRNVEFIKDYLRIEGFRISSQDLGGDYPRKIVYFPESGKVLLKKIEKRAVEPVVIEEQKMAKQINKSPIQGEVELFI